MVTQRLATKQGIGVLVNDEVSKSGGNSKQKTLEYVMSSLQAYYSTQDLELWAEPIEQNGDKTRYFVYKKGRAGDRQAFHGLVDVIYYGQKQITDNSSKSPCVFSAESFVVYFMVGPRKMDSDERTSLSIKERDRFLAHMRR